MLETRGDYELLASLQSIAESLRDITSRRQAYQVVDGAKLSAAIDKIQSSGGFITSVTPVETSYIIFYC